MKRILKHSLLASVIIAALLVILLPMLSERTLIAEKASFVFSTLKPPVSDALDNLRAMSHRAWHKITFTVKPALKSASHPSLTTAVSLGPTAWIVELKGIKTIQRAEELVEQLRSQGFPAYRVMVAHGEPRVFIGPEVRRANIDVLLKNVEKLTQYKGAVIPFDPLQLQV